MNKFLSSIAEILEVEVSTITPDTNFREDIEDWDSMKGFAIICMIEDDYNKSLDVATFLSCKTLKDLYAKLSE